MQTYWLHTNKASKQLIVFFAGFASHYSHYSHLHTNMNVLLCYDYRDFYFDIEILKEYDEVWLVAYSMGVSIATRLLQNVTFTRKIAFSGTNIGIDKTFGIHPTLFRHTIKHFNINDFKHAIFGENIIYTKDFYFAEQTILQEELQSLYDFCVTTPNFVFAWDRIYIAEKDSLFLPQVCFQAFENTNQAIYELSTWHYPFFAFHTWEEICTIS